MPASPPSTNLTTLGIDLDELVLLLVDLFVFSTEASFKGLKIYIF
jgi:hypothetical protein